MAAIPPSEQCSIIAGQFSSKLKSATLQESDFAISRQFSSSPFNTAQPSFLTLSTTTDLTRDKSLRS